MIRTPTLRQTGSRNLIRVPKTLRPWYGVPIWSLWPNIRFLPSIVAEKNVTKNVHFNVYKNQLSRQTGSRNLTGPKKLPTIWYIYMTLVTKYQISAINSYWEKCDEKYLGRTDRGKTVYPPPSPFRERGYKNSILTAFKVQVCIGDRILVDIFSCNPHIYSNYSCKKTK